MRKIALIGTPIQLVLTVAFGYAIGQLLGLYTLTLTVAVITMLLTPFISGMWLVFYSVRSQTGASIVAILHEGAFVPNPGRTYRFAAGDLVAVMGNAEQIAAFETWALKL